MCMFSFPLKSEQNVGGYLHLAVTALAGPRGCLCGQHPCTSADATLPEPGCGIGRGRVCSALGPPLVPAAKVARKRDGFLPPQKLTQPCNLKGGGVWGTVINGPKSVPYFFSLGRTFSMSSLYLGYRTRIVALILDLK